MGAPKDRATDRRFADYVHPDAPARPNPATIASFLLARSGEWDTGQPLAPYDSVTYRADRFQPDSVPADVWEQIKPVVNQVVLQAATGPFRAKEMSSLVTQIAWWCHREGLQTDLATILNPDVIDRFAVEGCKHLKEGTGGNYRSKLRRIGQIVIGPPLYPSQLQINRSDVTAPYSDAEVGDIVGWALGRPTTYMRENLEPVLGFGFGAGPSTQEFISAVGTDFVDYGDVLVWNVAIGRPRQVPILKAWESTARSVLARVGDAPIFRPERDSIRRNDLTSFFTNCSKDGAKVPPLTFQRFRVTWLVQHLRMATPPRSLELASGTTIRHIGEYTRFLADPAPEQFRKDMRGA
ncbi:MAG TPA: hypothetical protein VHC63_10195 [Acidimicrobiales bacterium]|nr:hypothetical protein [Acidimicrobiales bacterium]